MSTKQNVLNELGRILNHAEFLESMDVEILGTVYCCREVFKSSYRVTSYVLGPIFNPICDSGYLPQK